jgi:hypothetical protein
MKAIRRFLKRTLKQVIKWERRIAKLVVKYARRWLPNRMWCLVWLLVALVALSWYAKWPVAQYPTYLCFPTQLGNHQAIACLPEAVVRAAMLQQTI